MITAVTFVRCSVLLFLLAFDGSPAWSQADPTKVLVGTWDGWVEGIKDGDRMITIGGMKPKKGGGWTAEGRMGPTMEKSANQTFNVSIQDGAVVLTFVTAEKNPARLKLVGNDKLEGTMTFAKTKRIFKLEKVDPKAANPR
jgi:hypothetical protein